MHIHSDTHPEIAALEVELLRRLTPAQKLAMVGRLNASVRTLAIAGLQARHPDESPEKIKRRLADLLVGPELAQKAYGPIEAYL